MPAVSYSKTYPAAMDRKLRQLCRRLIGLAVVRALLLSMAVLLAAMLVAMTIDWCFTLFSTTVRTLLTATAVGASVATLMHVAVRPVLSSLGLRRAAGDVDHAIPQLEERWTTVANFVESSHQPRSAITNAMLRQVTSEAVAMERLVEPANVATPQRLRRAAVTFAGAAILVAAFLSSNWQYSRILLHRFWLPLAEITATRLECVSGDVVVPRGEPVELMIRMSGLPHDTATIVLASDGKEDATIALTSQALPSTSIDKQFQYHVAALESSFRYRVQAGDARTPWHSVTAIDRPSLAEVKVTLVAPEYVNRPIFEKDYLPTHLQAAQGSHLRLQMRPAAPLKKLELQITRENKPVNGGDRKPTDEQVLVLNLSKDGWYQYETILEEDLTITPSLLSSHDLRNTHPQKCNIRVIPDRAPIARVISPTEEMAATPNEVVEVKFEAHDDHGIAKAELIVYEDSAVEGEPPTIRSVEEIPLGDQENAPHVMATAKLDLSKYELAKGTNISYAIRVTDNRVAMRDNSLGKVPAGKESSQSAKRPAHEMAAASSKDGPVAEVSADTTSRRDRDTAATERDVAAGPEALALDRTTAQSGSPAKDAQLEDRPADEGDKGAKPRGAAEATKPADFASSNSTALRDKTEPTVNSAEGPATLSNADTALAKPTSRPPASPGDTKDDSVGSLWRSERDATALTTGASRTQPQPPRAYTGPGMPLAVTASDDPPRVNANEPGTRPSNATLPVSNVARDGDKRPSNNQALASNDLTPQASGFEPQASNRRPNMTDDMPGQFSESNRLRLKIEEKLVSAAESETNGEPIQMKIRERLERIDRQLQPAEEVLTSLLAVVSQSGIADPQLQELTKTDQQLAKVDEMIASLRKESKETPYAFVGLHMVEIGTAEITPARDCVFALVRQPDADAHSNVAEALHRVSRAREMLAELLVRYERVLREERLAKSIEETAKIYEVYVANLHRFLRAQSKPNPNPLRRKMAIVEVDQEYLDRLRQVTEMRRELMAEFGRMLADDPRLLSKYMDLIKRRQTSLRDRLTDLHQRQESVATELSGWLRVDAAQRDDVWMQVVEVRLQDVAPMLREVSQLEERTTSQFPLALDPQAKESAAVIQDAKQLAVSARTAATKARRLLKDPSNESIDLASDIEGMAFWLAELDAALEQLAFDNANAETTDFTDKRLAESRTLFERVVGWTEMVSYLQAHQFDGLAKVDQQQLAFRTELLRIDMEGIDGQLTTQFRGDVPESVTQLAQELKQLMEMITFNQAAATFELESQRLSNAESQQRLALEGFQRAEELFDQMRRTVIEELDKVNPPNPNIADLQDPTLDQLLEQLEREPNLSALLGLPNRPQNLRVISDFFASTEGDVPVPLALALAAEQSRGRTKDEQSKARHMRRETNKDDDKTEEEWKQVANAEAAQQKLQEKIDELNHRAADSRTDPESAEKFKQMAEQLSQMGWQLGRRPIDKQQWEEMIRSDQMRAILRAAARGEPLPDTQWNRLMSSLDDGLWQVRRRTPPEEFRQAIEQYHERIRKLTNVETADENR